MSDQATTDLHRDLSRPNPRESCRVSVNGESLGCVLGELERVTTLCKQHEETITAMIPGSRDVLPTVPWTDDPNPKGEPMSEQITATTPRQPVLQNDLNGYYIMDITTDQVWWHSHIPDSAACWGRMEPMMPAFWHYPTRDAAMIDLRRLKGEAATPSESPQGASVEFKSGAFQLNNMTDVEGKLHEALKYVEGALPASVQATALCTAISDGKYELQALRRERDALAKSLQDMLEIVEAKQRTSPTVAPAAPSREELGQCAWEATSYASRCPWESVADFTRTKYIAIGEAIADKLSYHRMATERQLNADLSAANREVERLASILSRIHEALGEDPASDHESLPETVQQYGQPGRER